MAKIHIEQVVVLVLITISLQAVLIQTGKSRCPFGPIHRPRKPSNQTCSLLNVTCNSNCKYRTYDGSCNNLKNPLWGVPDSRYGRLVPAQYEDGVYVPKLAKSGNNLPSARDVSVVIYPNVLALDGKWTLLNMQFGQFVAHDMSDAKPSPGPSDCCSVGTEANKKCLPIKVSSSDPDYSPINITCLNFTRSLTDRDSKCAGKCNVAEQLNDVNAYLDLSLVYGNDNDTNAELRLFSGGLLISEKRNNQHWLPTHPNASSTCRLSGPNDHCYIAGDKRVNQNPELTLLQTVFLREHNRIAKKLSQINPHWNDEILFQEARKINIGQYQIVVYNEWLPIILGSNLAANRSITIANATGFVNDYNQSINVAVLNEHATAAYRFFHTTIEGILDLNNEDRTVNSTTRISEWWNNPSIIEEEKDNADTLIRGMSTQAENAPDKYHTDEITFFWLRRRNASWGQDLKAIDIQRDRDHGLPSYNDIRVLIGLPRATAFENFTDVMSSESISQLESLYECPDDVELTVGGSLEKPTIGQGLAGPTFKAILAEQFWRTRVGDRYFVENSGVTGFNLNQLNELRKATISKILCDNANNVANMQPGGFELISDTNALSSCDDLPYIDLNLWKEDCPTITTSAH